MQRTAVSLFRIDWRQLGLVGLLLAIGWFLPDGRMAGMDEGPGTDPGTLGFYVSTWVVMMAAMMFPSIAPMVVAFARIQRRRRELGKASSGPPALVLFVGGYLVAWCAFGLVAFGVLKLFRSLSIDAVSWDRAGPDLAGAVVVAAAVYQLTPMKDVCLRKCRGPLDFLLGGWRAGYVGALRMGVAHGAWCVGCCWALMAALFAVGAMSLGWMAFIAALVAVEKMLPWVRVADSFPRGRANRALADATRRGSRRHLPYVRRTPPARAARSTSRAAVRLPRLLPRGRGSRPRTGSCHGRVARH